MVKKITIVGVILLMYGAFSMAYSLFYILDCPDPNNPNACFLFFAIFLIMGLVTFFPGLLIVYPRRNEPV